MPPNFDPAHHHRRSTRLRHYDYSQRGAYFITICAFQRNMIFGKLVDGEIELSTIGQIARDEWVRLHARFQTIVLGSFVLMPNHMHGILVISESQLRENDGALDGRGTASHDEAMIMSSSRRAPTADQSRNPPEAEPFERFGQPVRGSIPTIVRSYKSSVTLRVNRLRQQPNQPVWQRNYYEHVIRNDADFEQIDAYIQANPDLWEIDALNPKGS